MKEIKKEHILAAIKEIEANPLLRKGRASTTYDLIYEGNDYPPKLVVSIANRYATGEELDPNTFAGGNDTPAFQLLEKGGFEIIAKGEVTSDLNVKDEFTDWFILNDGKLSNYYSKQFGAKRERLVEEFDLYEVQYKENFNSDLFTIDANNFLKQIRTISNNIYDKTSEFSKFSEKRSNDRPRAILGKNNYIKFLTDLFSNKNTTKYWVFQGNPKTYDIIGALQSKALKSWSVKAHKGNINIGDKIILWMTGSQNGCYALAKVTSKIEYQKDDEVDYGFYIDKTDNTAGDRVSIEIEHDLSEDPILWKDINDNIDFEGFKGGNQGTNFTATKVQYETLVDLVGSNANNAYEAVKKVLHQRKLQSYLSLLRNFVVKHNINPSDDRISFNVWEKSNRLVFIIGRRYALNIEQKKGETEFSFISKEIITQQNGVFTNQKGEIEAYWNCVPAIENYTSVIEEGLIREIGRNAKCPYRKHTNQDFINDVFQIKQSTMEIMKPTTTFPLNQILYGPPGTGKTYRLQNEFFEKFTVKESSLTREQYLESIVSDLSWWQVISIAVLDLGESKVNDIHNHEFVKFKEKLSSTNTVRPTIWGQLQSHTIRDCPNVNVVSRSEPLFFSKSKDSKWSIDEVLLEEYYPEAKKLLEFSKNYKLSDDITIKNYDFVTFHQSFSYEDFVEGIKPRLEDGETEVSFEIKDGIFKKLCIKAEADPANNYAVFIDEINRGNVSAIFGELITLIEEDKRIGAANELRIKLPYSKIELGVPSNLYIIGTMNTADRSVEAIDTALRRRFSFSEIMPNPLLLEDKNFNGFNLAEVLKTINERVEVLLDRDHTIGHSYFLKTNNGDKEGLKSIFKNNIFPLLQEYFYHDYEKIALILGEGFVRIKENKTTKFAAFKNIDQPEIMTQFELIDEVEDIEEAVKLLLSN